MAHIKNLLFVTLCCLGFSACTRDKQAVHDPDKSYFSVRQFVADQYTLLKGQPLVFTKYTRVNDKTDSALVPYDEVDWSTILKLFCVTDISDNKYYERYEFNNIDDNILETSILSYTAKEPDLFVRKLNVYYDNLTGKIHMIYIETADNGRFHSKEQKLSYYVLDKIIIQESEKSLMSEPKEVMITYKFP